MRCSCALRFTYRPPRFVYLELYLNRYQQPFVRPPGRNILFSVGLNMFLSGRIDVTWLERFSSF